MPGLLKKLGFHTPAKRVGQNDMEFLDSGGIFAACNNTVIGQCFYLATIFAGKNDACHTQLPALLKGSDDVWGITGSGDAQKDVFLTHLACNLARKYFTIAVIVTDGGEDRTINSQGLSQ